MIKDKIQGLLADKFHEEDFADCFFVDFKFSEVNNKLEVFVDSDSGMTFRKCQQISRYLEGFIDENNWLGAKYILEVSSPGLSRPLKLKRQYLNNIGRKLELHLTEGKPQSGILTTVEEDAITIQKEVKQKGKKKKAEAPEEIRVPFETIKKAVVIVSFKKR